MTLRQDRLRAHFSFLSQLLTLVVSRGLTNVRRCNSRASSRRDRRRSPLSRIVAVIVIALLSCLAVCLCVSARVKTIRLAVQPTLWDTATQEALLQLYNRLLLRCLSRQALPRTLAFLLRECSNPLLQHLLMLRTDIHEERRVLDAVDLLVICRRHLLC